MIGIQTSLFDTIFFCNISRCSYYLKLDIVEKMVQTTKSSFMSVCNGPVNSDGFLTLLYCLSHYRH